MLTLHNLQSNKKAVHRKRRVGRGNASGKGNYSGRGMKGQRSRSGGKSGLAARSMKSYLLRIPKTRGFQSLNKSMAVVNVRDLEDKFNSGNKINARSLLKEGLINTISNGVKVLSFGTLNKKLIVEANAFSKSAIAKIEAVGGKAIIVGQKKDQPNKENKK